MCLRQARVVVVVVSMEGQKKGQKCPGRLSRREAGRLLYYERLRRQVQKRAWRRFRRKCTRRQVETPDLDDHRFELRFTFRPLMRMYYPSEAAVAKQRVDRQRSSLRRWERACKRECQDVMV